MPDVDKSTKEVQQEAGHLLKEAQQGQNICAELERMPRNEALKVVHEMSQEKKEHPDAYPNLSIMDDENGAWINQTKDGKTVGSFTAPSDGLMAAADKEQHPEREAKKIEELGKKAAGGDAQAKEDLQNELIGLNKENRKYRDDVLDQVKKDGEGVGLAPKADIERDEKGNVKSIEFSRYFGYQHTKVEAATTEEQQARAREEAAQREKQLNDQARKVLEQGGPQAGTSGAALRAAGHPEVLNNN